MMGVFSEPIEGTVYDGSTRKELISEIDRLKYELDGMTMFRDGKAQEVERLSAQIEQFRFFLLGNMLRHTKLPRDLIIQHMNSIDETSSYWLAIHDSKIRDDALSDGTLCRDSTSKDGAFDMAFETIRAMKGV
jgi:hypothetical protein